MLGKVSEHISDKRGFESLKMNMKVNQDNGKNLQWFDLTCGKGSNLAIAPPELTIWRKDALGFTPPTTQSIARIFFSISRRE